MGARYWHSWPEGRGRRSGYSVPLSWVVLFCIFFWWLILLAIAVRIAIYVIAYTYRYFRERGRNRASIRSNR